MYVKRDPGPCPVDDAPHTTCCAPDPVVIAIVQMPMRDGLTPPPLVGAVPTPTPLLAERIQATLPEGHVTSGTYRQKRRRP
jgi:hypothetical protein